MFDLFLAGPTVDAYTLTGDRVVATTAAVVALASVVCGVVALVRTRRRPAVVALVAGSLGLIAGLFVIVTADGGPGTGNGIVGGFAAVPLGLAAVVLGSLALRNFRKLARTRGGVLLDQSPGHA
ncbi:DUF6223 family protein [Actinoplanes sp. NPDC023714]|uniref:DUF6223 family protein n=1 Tax=Actinoplanes sp. NPDC023714 TaxID=3154322 RepID=UPI0033DAE8D9